MKIIAVYSIKGGVGKTAAAVNLAYLAAANGLRTLLCDLDPQSSATYYFRIKPKLKTSAKKLVQGKKSVDPSTKATDFENLDLLPADFSLRKLDLILDSLKRPRKRLKEMFVPLKKEYDLVFLDCPPNITLVSENVFRAADILLIPVIPTTLSARTLDKLSGFLNKAKLKKKILLPFFSMVEKRKRLHKQLIKELPEQFPEFLSTSIPYSSDVERMGIYRQPLVHAQANSPAARAFLSLWRELQERFF